MFRCMVGLRRTCPQSKRFPSMKRGQNVDGRWKNELPSMKTRDFMDGMAPAGLRRSAVALLRKLMLDLVEPDPAFFVTDLFDHVEAYPADVVDADLVECAFDQ